MLEVTKIRMIIKAYLNKKSASALVIQQALPVKKNLDLLSRFLSVPEEIRTPDLQFRKLLLYPTELLGHNEMDRHLPISFQRLNYYMTI